MTADQTIVRHRCLPTRQFVPTERDSSRLQLKRIFAIMGQPDGGKGGNSMRKRMSKRQLSRELYEQGLRVDAISELLDTDPAYVANSLIAAGHAPAYVDLYTHTGPQNRYAGMLAGVLRFKDLGAARESVARIDEMYHQFKQTRDRR